MNNIRLYSPEFRPLEGFIWLWVGEGRDFQHPVKKGPVAQFIQAPFVRCRQYNAATLFLRVKHES